MAKRQPTRAGLMRRAGTGRFVRHLLPAIVMLGGSAVPALAQQYGRAAPVVAPYDSDQTQYRLAPGDQVAIVFPSNAELNTELPIGPDGRLTLPLAGAIPVAGLTSTQAEARISAALRRANIVEDARPSLLVRTYGASVYVGGEVRTPGAVRLNGPMDAMRAVIMAGGVLETARSKRVVVIRQMPDGSPSLRYVDLRAYLKTGGVGQDEPLRAQDVIFVPRSSVAEANLWIDQHINRMLPFSRSLNYNVGDVAARSVVAP